MRVQKFTPLALLKILESFSLAEPWRDQAGKSKEEIIEARDRWISDKKILNNGVLNINIYDDIDGERLVVEINNHKYRISKSDVTLEHLI